jgi:hypothetical protein
MSRICPAKTLVFGVDPTRLELVTSAMRRRPEGFAGVRGYPENRLDKSNSYTLRLLVFAGIRPGYCQVTVKRQLGQSSIRDLGLALYA